MNLVKKTITSLAILLEKVLLYISIIVLLLLVITVSTQVFIRYILHDSLPWVQEISSGLLIWLTFIGSAYLVRGNRHLRVDMFINKIPRHLGNLITIVINFFNIAFIAVLIIVSFKLFNTQIKAPLGVLGIPRAFYFALPILIFSITTPVYLLESILNKDNPIGK